MATPKISANDIIQAIVGYRVAGQQCLLVRHFIARGAFTPGVYLDEMEAVLDSLDSDIIDDLLPILSSNWRVNFSQAQRISPVRSHYVRRELDLPGGNATLNAASVNLAAVITLQGEVPGRGKSGSVHVGGFVDSDVDDNSHLSAGLITKLNTLAASVAEIEEAASPDSFYDPIIFNKSNPLASSIIVNYSVQPYARTMRRRTVGRGI